MPKRKNREEDVQRKIAKYERRLAKYRDIDACTPELMDPELELLEVDPSQPEPELHANSPGPEACSPRPDTCSPGPDAGSPGPNADLDVEFLTALGESTRGGTKKYGEQIHQKIFNTVEKILLEGLSKQNKEKLIEDLLVPVNCKLLDAPKLNTELIGVLNNPSRVRDKLMESRQQEMGLAIGSICSVINSLSKQEYNKYDIIKKPSDTSRILCHLHYQYTDIRRRLVNPFLDKNLAESLKDNKREDFLYSNLDNSVKSYSAMKRDANVIKPRSTHTPRNLQQPKNFHQPPRRPNAANQAHPGRGSYRGAQRYHTPRQPYRPQDNRPTGPSARGRAKYP